MIIQILLRLPIKSLIRFKCVCKSWLSLISNDTHFALSHFQLTSSTRRIMIIRPVPYRHCLSIDFEASFKNDSSYASSNIDFCTPKTILIFNLKALVEVFTSSLFFSHLYMEPIHWISQTITFVSLWFHFIFI